MRLRRYCNCAEKRPSLAMRLRRYGNCTVVRTPRGTQRCSKIVFALRRVAPHRARVPLQIAPRSRQDHAKIAPRRAKIAPRSRQDGPRSRKTRQDHAKTRQETLQDAPKTRKNDPRSFGNLYDKRLRSKNIVFSRNPLFPLQKHVLHTNN